VILLALLVCSPLDLFGFTPRGTAMAGALTAEGGLNAAFYNPAAMSFPPGPGSGTMLGIGLADSVPALHIDRALPQSTVASAMPEAAPRLELGAVVPIRGIFHFGAAMSFPTNRLLRLENLDSQRPQFLLYQSKPQRFAVAVNASALIGSRISLGAGMAISQSQSGLYRFGLDVPDRTVTVREEQVDATFAPVFTAGGAVQVTDWMRVAFVWRGAQSQHTDVPTEFELQGLGSLLVQTAGTTLYWPNTLSLGASFGARALRVMAQVDVQLWSQAPSEELQFAILPSGQVLTDSGLADLLGYNSPARRAGFQSVVVPRAALEWSLRSLTLRAGLAFKPAITPDQFALTSYLDSPTVIAGAGATVAAGQGLFIDAAVAGTLLFERQMHKASATNPTGDASFGGSLWTFSTMLRYEY